MKYRWDDNKNEELKSEGRPSFEDAVEAINTTGLVSNDKNPVHASQRLFVVMINNYPHAVPYEIRGDVIWLNSLPCKKIQEVKYGKAIQS